MNFYDWQFAREITPILLQGLKVTLIATDRFRLAIREFDWEPAREDVTVEVLIPTKALSEVTRADVEKAFDKAEAANEKLNGLTEDARELDRRIDEVALETGVLL